MSDTSENAINKSFQCNCNSSSNNKSNNSSSSNRILLNLLNDSKLLLNETFNIQKSFWQLSSKLLQFFLQSNTFEMKKFFLQERKIYKDRNSPNGIDLFLGGKLSLKFFSCWRFMESWVLAATEPSREELDRAMLGRSEMYKKGSRYFFGPLVGPLEEQTN